ncbi:unnamed protein product [Parascedosporium putredinis]|uniref:FAD/NAD(P)-binding domain-containing protein n=1 Tax=Parascedosporium putredinis TaxID=1442378 RepID=A0A9P1M5Z2_9PEZI|nr:unnamed protein product [Parascedosporium putredinis]CAI7987820.1 unnamed protein product [Parascedosporium putredinis]
MSKTVVVVGASFAGLAVSHRLLKYTRQKEKNLRVVLVSPTSHFYWNLASIRAVVPGLIKEDQIFHPIEPGFSLYPKENFEFVYGSATSVDTDAKTASVAAPDGEKTLKYDYLVLATGARSANDDVPWKPLGSHEETVQQLRDTAKKVGAAKTILVAGAGATGCETSSEIKHKYGADKDVILLAADAEVMGGDVLASNMEYEMKKLGVDVRKNARVASTEVLADGRTEVRLVEGAPITVDLYLPTMGLKPNTGYLSEKLLNENKYVEVDEFYQVKNAENVWACGDIVSKPRAGFMITDKQAAGVAKNIELVIQGKAQLPVKLLPVDALMCAAGRDRGAGRIGNVKVFSIMAWALKGRTLGMPWAPKYVDGTQW